MPDRIIFTVLGLIKMFLFLRYLIWFYNGKYHRKDDLVVSVFFVFESFSDLLYAYQEIVYLFDPIGTVVDVLAVSSLLYLLYFPKVKNHRRREFK
jgi:hypothetical protein